jgi:predicted TIM-barrel fold metal-dependent hydrolase
MKAMQIHMRRHMQPACRTSDNALVEEETLWDGKNTGISGLLDVNFRIGKFGRLEWTKDGVEYYMSWMPPSMQEMQAPPEMMISHMDYVGIDKALLHNAHVYGMLNDFLSDCVRRYPDRLAAIAQIHESQADQEGEILELRRAIKELGLIGLHFQVEGFFLIDHRYHLDDERYNALWEEVRALRIPVLWNIRPVAEPRPESYLDQIRRLGVWAKRYPDIPAVFTHGLNVAMLRDSSGHVSIPDDLIEVLMLPNMFLELLLAVMQGGIWDYPYAEAHEIVKFLYGKLGPSKLIWGSDMPCAERICTYSQSIDYLRRYCSFINPTDMDAILGGNAAKLFRFG